MPPGLNEAPNEDIADKASDSVAVGAMQGYCAVNSSVFEKVVWVPASRVLAICPARNCFQA